MVRIFMLASFLVGGVLTVAAASKWTSCQKKGDMAMNLKLLGKSREELRPCLQEDDFLFVKLGMVKPKHEELKWNDGEVKKWRSARVLREVPYVI